FANQGAFDPKAAGLVKEVSHLGGHVPETSRRAEDEGIVIRKFFRRSNWRLLIDFTAMFLELFLRDQFGHPFYRHFDTFNRTSSFGDSARQGFDVPIHGIIENE